MEPSTRPEPESSELTPYLLSREYEDHLDWLENRRRTRSGGDEDRPRFLKFFSLAAGLGTFVGVVMRHVRAPRG